MILFDSGNGFFSRSFKNFKKSAFVHFEALDEAHVEEAIKG